MWGSQIDLPAAPAKYDGVTGFWYGKGPGVDRATDALRHANMYGVNRRGGAVLLVGDDPASKSSTVPAVSERSLAALGIPVLFPRNATEIVTLGLHAIEMSRASGCVVALKIVADVADGAWVVDSKDLQVNPIAPAIDWNGNPYAYTQSPIVLRPAMIVGAEAEPGGPADRAGARVLRAQRPQRHRGRRPRRQSSDWSRRAPASTRCARR
ncbi:hypothetical protein [Nocardioides convexus]|uniref:hypothetical protein n=1 Tax=Nocardioides convexus TaxID=2712224 RepID=UPI0024186115|nr:hypothetical protein [Nocardioides convexus]